MTRRLLPPPPPPRETKRIQLSRALGFRKQAGVVVVTRSTRWGNPWRVVPVRDPNFPLGDAADVLHVNGDRSMGRFPRFSTVPETGASYWAVRAFERDLTQEFIDDVYEHLHGKDLACWCPLSTPTVPFYCHADVLLRLARG
ncbi:protein of unknown function [Frankineae bacterium MT45]|nr:protein of unknown function [Frankineae bacterium MT45]